MNELKRLILREGQWGDFIEQCQAKVAPSQTESFDNETAKVISIQDKMKDTTYDWKLTGNRHFPLLTTVAVCLSSYVSQSANVERVCKAHKVVHSLSRNRLKNETVHKLLYLYVNLRLIKKCKDGVCKFLEDVVEADLQGEHEEMNSGSNLPEVQENGEGDDNGE